MFVTQTQTIQSSCVAQIVFTTSVISASDVTSTIQNTITYTQSGQSTTLVQAFSNTISPILSSSSQVQILSTSAPKSSPIPSSSIPVPSNTISTSASSSSCPTNLNGEYQYPHLILPISFASPSTSLGTSYNDVINSTVFSIFNFEILSTYTGTCSPVFLFPTQDQLETSSYTFSGNGDVDFAQLSTIGTQSTTYDSIGSVAKDLGTFTLTPGSSTVISTFACPKGETSTGNIE
ncbi:hypothetical protein ACMFMF_008763 [Clarireedia jacksonii]